MPRVSEAEKRKSHKRILDAAARLMREQGVETTSVTDVMSAAGLTHGGFYRHFASKEDLAAAAFRHAVEEILNTIETAPSSDERAKALDDYIATYLSAEHVYDPGNGCPLAAIGSEAARQDGPLQSAVEEAVWRMADILCPSDHAPTDAGREQGLAMMALLLGTVTLARFARHAEDAEAILLAGRDGMDALKQGWSLS